jgi:hypothetical protein
VSPIRGKGGGAILSEDARGDQAVAGLITDLKRRGMLDDTLVVWTTEFGRTPYNGRDYRLIDVEGEIVTDILK